MREVGRDSSAGRGPSVDESDGVCAPPGLSPEPEPEPVEDGGREERVACGQLRPVGPTREKGAGGSSAREPFTR